MNLHSYFSSIIFHEIRLLFFFNAIEYKIQGSTADQAVQFLSYTRDDQLRDLKLVRRPLQL